MVNKSYQLIIMLTYRGNSKYCPDENSTDVITAHDADNRCTVLRYRAERLECMYIILMGLRGTR